MGSSLLDTSLRQVGLMRQNLNNLLAFEPFVLVGTTALTTYFIHKCLEKIPNEGAYEGIKQHFFKIVKKIPAVKSRIDKELDQTEILLREKYKNLLKKDEKDEIEFILTLPHQGWKPEAIIEKLVKYIELGKYEHERSITGSLYFRGKSDLADLNTQMYSLFAWSNPLHPDVFPGICKMEAEVVQIMGRLFNGGSEICGTVTSCGTESLILAVKAYRDYGREVKGITKPNIVIPRTAHPAFCKAAQYMDIAVRFATVDEKTMTVNIKDMKKLISKSTICIVGSAPAFPHGIMDDIEKIAELGVKYNIPVHVDGCLGGFVLAFMEKAGFDLPPYDFRVKGVTSISADSHKYGMTPKGSSVLLFSELKYKRFQYFLVTEWPGGIYASPTLPGSRAGVSIAGCWATLMHFGLDGYVSNTKKIVETTRYIVSRFRQIDGIYVIGNPDISVIAIASDVFDIYNLSEALNKKGWNICNLQFPPSLHLTIGLPQTEPEVAELFLEDLELAVEEILKNPNAPTTGFGAMYGSSQKLPDRSLVCDFAKIYLDSLYETNFN